MSQPASARPYGPYRMEREYPRNVREYPYRQLMRRRVLRSMGTAALGVGEDHPCRVRATKPKTRAANLEQANRPSPPYASRRQNATTLAKMIPTSPPAVPKRMSSAELRVLGFSAVPNSRSPAYSPSSQIRVRTITTERARSAAESQPRTRWRSVSPRPHPARVPTIACATALVLCGPMGEWIQIVRGPRGSQRRRAAALCRERRRFFPRRARRGTSRT